MKRSWLITILVCLLILGGGGAVLLLPQVVPFDQCSDVYKRYADMDGVNATFIKDYKVNDSVYVNVTLLQSKTDSAWLTLVQDFNIVFPDDATLPTDTNSVSFWFAPHDNYKLPMDTIFLNNDIVAVSTYKHIVSIFHIDNESQFNAIVYHQIISTNN